MFVKTENYKYRIHVCPLVGKMYIISKKELGNITRYNNLKIVYVFQNGIKTSRGYLLPIPLYESSFVKIVSIPIKILKKNYIKQNDREKMKGQKAESIVMDCFKKKFQITKTSKDENLKGIDLFINRIPFQIKCDFTGGNGEKILLYKNYLCKEPSGNLYIEIEELNPFKKY